MQLTEDMLDLGLARRRLIEHLQRTVTDVRVVAAMTDVPRERFVPASLRASAYEDRALPIGEGQTISQPLMVALQLAAADIQPQDRALEVGTGSGYQAAVLARLCAEVVTVERVPSLLEGARAALSGAQNVVVERAGAVLGAPERAPFDVIVVAAAGPHVPRSLLQQLGQWGRLVMPLGTRHQQELVRVRLTERGTTLERLGPCAFVPLVAAEAWADE